MKIQTPIPAFLVATVISSFLFSCKKDKAEDKEVNCRLSSITHTSGSDAFLNNISYNSDNKISKIEVTDTDMPGVILYKKTFSHIGNTIIINTVDGTGSFAGADSVTLDVSGRVLNIRQFYNAAHTSWHNQAFEYNSNILHKIYSAYNNSATGEDNITCVNGNITARQSSGSSISFEYFTDKEIQAGDYMQSENLLYYGVKVYPQKNLVKKIDSGMGNSTSLAYEMNSDGQISKVTITDGTGSVATRTFQYQCN